MVEGSKNTTKACRTLPWTPKVVPSGLGTVCKVPPRDYKGHTVTSCLRETLRGTSLGVHPNAWTLHAKKLVWDFVHPQP